MRVVCQMGSSFKIKPKGVKEGFTNRNTFELELQGKIGVC